MDKPVQPTAIVIKSSNENMKTHYIAIAVIEPLCRIELGKYSSAPARSGKRTSHWAWHLKNATLTVSLPWKLCELPANCRQQPRKPGNKTKDSLGHFVSGQERTSQTPEMANAAAAMIQEIMQISDFGNHESCMISTAPRPCLKAFLKVLGTAQRNMLEPCVQGPNHANSSHIYIIFII